MQARTGCGRFRHQNRVYQVCLSSPASLAVYSCSTFCCQGCVCVSAHRSMHVVLWCVCLVWRSSLSVFSCVHRMTSFLCMACISFSYSNNIARVCICRFLLEMFDGSCMSAVPSTAKDAILPTNEDRWHHVAASLSGITKTILLDGVNIFSQSCANQRRVNQTLVNIFVGGATPDNDFGHWEGMLDGELIMSNALLLPVFASL